MRDVEAVTKRQRKTVEERERDSDRKTQTERQMESICFERQQTTGKRDSNRKTMLKTVRETLTVRQ